MNSRKKLAGGLSAALALSLMLTACGGGSVSSGTSAGAQGSVDDYYTFSFSMHTAADSTIGNVYQQMFDEIEEKTDGHVKITLYGSATLSSPSDVADMVKDGGCDIGWLFTGFYYGQYPLSDVITLPGNYPESCEQGTKVLWDLYNEYEQVQDEWADYHILNMYANPVSYLYTAAPIDTVDDLTKLTMRGPSGAVTEILTSMGVNMVSSAPGDIFDNISKNNIQGYVAEPTILTDYSLIEVTDNIVYNLPIYQGPYVTVMNKDKYDSLPAEYQAVLDEYSTVDASVAFGAAWQAQVEDSMQQLLDSGANKVEWSQADLDVFDGYADSYAETWAEQYSTDGFDAAAYRARCIELYQQYSEQ